MAVGLVLEGGGMRGLYTAGVLDTFLDAGIKVNGVVSVSAGALFGVNFLSKQKGRASVTIKNMPQIRGTWDFVHG